MTASSESPATEQARGGAPGLVALDIDGTVLSWDGEIPGETRAAVRRIVDAGAHVVLATGRTLLATRPVAEALGLTGGYLVCSNGAVTATLDPPEVTDVVTFDPAPVVALLREHLPEALFAVEELDVGHRLSGHFPEGELAGRLRVVAMDELVAEPATRVVLRSPQHDLHRRLRRAPREAEERVSLAAEPIEACWSEAEHDFAEVITRIGLRDVSYAVGHTAWLDIAPEGVSKASALTAVAERLGVPRSATVAVGDGRNDIEMLRWAGTGIAMGDAPAEVQDAADTVTHTFADGGLPHALSRWFP